MLQGQPLTITAQHNENVFGTAEYWLTQVI